MDYLERMLPKKSDPWSTFPYAKAVIVLTFTNGWGDPAAKHPFPVPESGAPVGHADEPVGPADDGDDDVRVEDEQVELMYEEVDLKLEADGDDKEAILAQDGFAHGDTHTHGT